MKIATNENSRRSFLRNSIGVMGTVAGTLMGVPALAQSLKTDIPLREGLPSSGKTPRQTLGPFFPDDGDPVTEIRENLDFRLPVSEANDNDLTTIRGKNGKAKGQVIYIKGKVIADRFGAQEPVPGAVLIEWNASASGRYNHRQYPISASDFGRMDRTVAR